MSNESDVRCDDRRIARVMDAIVSDLTRQVTRNDAARIANLEPGYFSKRFRQIVGVSFKVWNTTIRIEEAKRLLLTLDRTMAEVAAGIGFGDASVFGKSFKKYTGVCPRSFRTSLRTSRSADGRRETYETKTPIL